MKILLLVLISLVVLLLGVVLIGWLLPKRHVVSRRASYRTTADRLFSLIAGPQDWRPNLRRSEVVLDVPGRELLRETARNGERDGRSGRGGQSGRDGRRGRDGQRFSAVDDDVVANYVVKRATFEELTRGAA